MNIELNDNYQNHYLMSIDQLKETIHLRIEQADEKMLRVFAQLMETMFSEYQPEIFEKDRQERIAAYESMLKPMTREELIARAKASDEDIKAGRVHDLDEVKAELGL